MFAIVPLLCVASACASSSSPLVIPKPGDLVSMDAKISNSYNTDTKSYRGAVHVEDQGKISDILGRISELNRGMTVPLGTLPTIDTELEQKLVRPGAKGLSVCATRTGRILAINSARQTAGSRYATGWLREPVDHESLHALRVRSSPRCCALSYSSLSFHSHDIISATSFPNSFNFVLAAAGLLNGRRAMCNVQRRTADTTKLAQRCPEIRVD